MDLRWLLYDMAVRHMESNQQRAGLGGSSSWTGRSLGPAAELHRSRVAERPVLAPRAGRARPSHARPRRERRV